MDATFSALVRDDAVATVGRSSVTAQKKCWRGRRRFPSSSSALIARPTAVDLNGRSCFHRGKRTPTRSDRRACGSAFVACRRPGRLNNWFTATGTIAEGSAKFAASTPSVAGEARTDWASFQECPLSRRSSLSSRGMWFRAAAMNLMSAAEAHGACGRWSSAPVAVLRHRRPGRAAAAREPDQDRARRPGHPLGLRRVHGIAQMRDTHTGDDCRIPEDDRCVRDVVEQPHSCA